MSNTNDKEWKKISFGEFDAHANAYIAELVDELLREKDIDPTAFAFRLEVDYMEMRNIKHIENDLYTKDLYFVFMKEIHKDLKEKLSTTGLSGEKIC